MSFPILGFAIVLFSLILKNVFFSEKNAKTFQRHFNKTRFVIKRYLNKTRIALGWRGSRVLAGAWRTLLFSFLGIFVAIVFSVTANGLASETMKVETNSFKWPSGSPTVSSILLSGDNTLYIGTNSGIYFLSDDSKTWPPSNSGLTSTHITSLSQGKDNTLYAGTDGGVFLSHDNAKTWQSSNTGLKNTKVTSLLQANVESLYAGTNDGSVFVARETEAISWESLTKNLTILIEPSKPLSTPSSGLDLRGGLQVLLETDVPENSTVNPNDSATPQIIMDNRANALGVGEVVMQSAPPNRIVAQFPGLTNSNDVVSALQETGVLEFVDMGTLNAVTHLVQDERGTLYKTNNNDDVFYSVDQGLTWIRMGQWKKDYFIYAHIPFWVLYENIHGRQPMWFLNDLTNSVMKSMENGQQGIQYYYSGTSIYKIITRQAPDDILLPWWALRTWTEFWFMPRWGYFAGGTFLLIALWGMVTYGNTAWALKIRPWKFSRVREIIQNNDGKNFDFPILKQWHKSIQSDLVTFGDITSDDLIIIPALLRKSVLSDYLHKYESDQALQKRGRHLVLVAGGSLKTWQTAWQRVAENFSHKAGLSAQEREQVVLLAKSFCNVLGFSLNEYHEVQSASSWRVEAPALRLNLPPRFPLIFIADLNPSPETVRILFDTVSVLKETTYFTLVIPLEPESADVDIPQVLRRVIDSSPYAHDFVVLSHEDVIDILVARYPERILVRQISRQVDISFISPFVVNGPVPLQMFFGRDKEIRNLVDHAVRRNFAIVGNRKIGKTSLLNQVEARLAGKDGVYLLRMDCQAVCDAADFYKAIQNALGINLGADTPSALMAAIRIDEKLSKPPLVLMLDEVDTLLAAEKSQGEALLSVLRQLANEHTCTFIFCGGRVLAQQLRNPESAMFNFPEALPLPYLSREEMDDVIIRPLA
jgi:photosystem II stability/assembly factor-like uncharacterized protein